MSADKDQRIADLEQQVAAEKERAEYVVRNLNITEKARQGEMAKRDALTEQVATLTKERDEAVRVLLFIREERDDNDKAFRHWHSMYLAAQAQIAALTKENERLQTACNKFSESEILEGNKLAASQAREQKLREALERNEREIYHLRADRGWTNQSEFRPSEILALPQDDTALQARLNVEREKCAERASEISIRAGDAIRSMT